jgi:hypothetical protein
VTRRIRRAAVGALLLGVVTACGSGSSGGQSLSSTPTTRQIDEKANGTTVDVHLGDTIVVVLHSTYWSVGPATGPLQPLGQPQPSPSDCPVKGGGCGTVTATYNAGHVGDGTLRAHRDSCGEALRCTGSDADWTVTVHIT